MVRSFKKLQDIFILLEKDSEFSNFLKIYNEDKSSSINSSEKNGAKLFDALIQIRKYVPDNNPLFNRINDIVIIIGE